MVRSPRRPSPATLAARIAAFLADESGAQVVEVALLTGVMALASALVERQAGRAIAAMLWRVADAFPV